MCGVIGVIGSPEAAKEVFLGLITLQHRGQDAAGILSYDCYSDHGDHSFHLEKNTGLVESIFSREAIERLAGSWAIGHTRYSTVGKGSIQDVQPLLLNYPYGIGMVHNGNIVNYPQLKDRLQSEMRRRCLTNSDTESVLNWFADKITGLDSASIENAARSVFENVQGSYSIVGLIGEAGLFAFRDPYGIRPLVLGSKVLDGKTVYMVASETVALNFLGYKIERNIEPGELLFIDRDLKITSQIFTIQKASHRPCMFEWVYFASAESEVESTPVYSARLALGKNLAARIADKIKRGEIEADLIAPVPDTARTAAISLSEALGVAYREVLIKNRYITRTFILGSQSKREKAVDLKMNPILSEIAGKNIILVDDSIVRGTTSKKIVQLVRRAGAKKVYFASTCPPIRYPCFYGIDFPDQNELIAARKSNETSVPSLESLEELIAKELGADGVIYQDMTGLVKSISDSSHGRIQNPCRACLDGQYPADVSESARFAQLRKSERQ